MNNLMLIIDEDAEAKETTVDTSTLTAGRSPQGQTVTLRADARQPRERLARRLRLALIALGRRQDAQRTYGAIAERRRNELIANALRDAEFARTALLAPMI